MGISPSEYLLRELRRRRCAAGLTQTQLGERVYRSDSQVSAIETGTRPPSPDYLAAVDEALDTGGYFATLWEELVRGDASPLWFREWINVEREAIALRWYEHSYVPGLLQTEAYARAVLAAACRPPGEIDRRVAARLERQEVLTREAAPHLIAVLDEAVIRRECGGPDVMAGQVRHLLDVVAERPNVHVHIVPASAGAYAGLAGAMILADLPDGTRVGHVDNLLCAQTVSSADAIVTLGRAWEAIRSVCLPLGQTADVLREAAKSWGG